MWSQSTTVIHLFVFIFLQNMHAIFTLNLLALTRITRFYATIYLLAVTIFVLHVKVIIIFIDNITVKWIPCTILASRACQKRAATEYASAGIRVNYRTAIVLSALPYNFVMYFWTNIFLTSLVIMV